MRYTTRNFDNFRATTDEQKKAWRMAKDYAETMRSSSDSLLTLINDILDYSKIEAGKLDLEQRPFEIGQCLEEAFDQVTAKAHDKDLELGYLIDETVPDTILGDISRLRQILVNLLNSRGISVSSLL